MIYYLEAALPGGWSRRRLAARIEAPSALAAAAIFAAANPGAGDITVWDNAADPSFALAPGQMPPPLLVVHAGDLDDRP